LIDAEDDEPRSTRMMLGQLLVVIGAVAIIVSLFLHWLDLSVSVGGVTVSRTGNAVAVPVQFLFDRHETANDPTILVILIPAAALGLAGAWFRQQLLVIVAALAALFVPGMYAYQMDGGLGELTGQTGGLVHVKLNDIMGVAPYVCGVGGTIMLVGGFLLNRRAPEPPVNEAEVDRDIDPSTSVSD
jgi:hypothetical protein